MANRSILFQKIAMLRDEISCVEARQTYENMKMQIPRYDTTMEVLSERLKVAEEELEQTNEQMYNV